MPYPGYHVVIGTAFIREFCNSLQNHIFLVAALGFLS